MNKKYKEASLGNPLIFSFIILSNEQFNWKNSFFMNSRVDPVV